MEEEIIIPNISTRLDRQGKIRFSVHPCRCRCAQHRAPICSLQYCCTPYGRLFDIQNCSVHDRAQWSLPRPPLWDFARPGGFCLLFLQSNGGSFLGPNLPSPVPCLTPCWSPERSSSSLPSAVFLPMWQPAARGANAKCRLQRKSCK